MSTKTNTRKRKIKSIRDDDDDDDGGSGSSVPPVPTMDEKHKVTVTPDATSAAEKKDKKKSCECALICPNKEATPKCSECHMRICFDRVACNLVNKKGEFPSCPYNGESLGVCQTHDNKRLCGVCFLVHMSKGDTCGACRLVNCGSVTREGAAHAAASTQKQEKKKKQKTAETTAAVKTKVDPPAAAASAKEKKNDVAVAAKSTSLAKAAAAPAPAPKKADPPAVVVADSKKMAPSDVHPSTVTWKLADGTFEKKSPFNKLVYEIRPDMPSTDKESHEVITAFFVMVCDRLRYEISLLTASNDKDDVKRYEDIQREVKTYVMWFGLDLGITETTMAKYRHAPYYHADDKEPGTPPDLPKTISFKQLMDVSMVLEWMFEDACWKQYASIDAKDHGLYSKDDLARDLVVNVFELLRRAARAKSFSLSSHGDFAAEMGWPEDGKFTDEWLRDEHGEPEEEAEAAVVAVKKADVEKKSPLHRCINKLRPTPPKVEGDHREIVKAFFIMMHDHLRYLEYQMEKDSDERTLLLEITDDVIAYARRLGYEGLHANAVDVYRADYKGSKSPRAPEDLPAIGFTDWRAAWDVAEWMLNDSCWKEYALIQQKDTGLYTKDNRGRDILSEVLWLLEQQIVHNDDASEAKAHDDLTGHGKYREDQGWPDDTDGLADWYYGKTNGESEDESDDDDTDDDDTDDDGASTAVVSTKTTAKDDTKVARTGIPISVKDDKKDEKKKSLSSASEKKVEVKKSSKSKDEKKTTKTKPKSKEEKKKTTTSTKAKKKPRVVDDDDDDFSDMIHVSHVNVDVS